MRLTLILLTVISLAGREPIPVDFSLSSPGWGGEVITLPPGFARDMQTVGVEDIRFAPGMFKADAEDFFSYIFVITSTKGQTFETDFVRSELLLYYQGLAKSVSRGKIDPGGFALKLEPVKAQGLKAAYTGTLDWVEPFATRKAQTLHFDVQVRVEDGRDYLIVCVSPQKSDHAVWPKLHKVRESFRLKQ